MKQLRRQKQFVRASSSPESSPTVRERLLLRQIADLDASCQQLKQQQQQQQQELHDRLRDAVRRYEDLYELAPVSFVTLDRQGRITDGNKKAARLLGFPSDWLQKKPFLAFIAPGDVHRFLVLLGRLRRGSSHMETMRFELSIANRSVPAQIWMRLAPNSEDATVYLMAILDLTLNHAIEMELQESLNNWYSLVGNAPDLIMTVDHKGRIRYVNRGAWGRNAQELVGTALTGYATDKDRGKLENCVEQACNNGRASTCELNGFSGDQDRWYSFSFGPLEQDELENPNRTTTVTIRDVTEHKRTEQSLRESREQLRNFAARLDVVREEERKSVAREIHDELGQALTILKMDLAWVHGKARKNPAATQKKIKSMIGDVDQTIDLVRKIITELRPSILDEVGLTAALEWQVSQFQERTGIRGRFECISNSDGSSSDNFNLPKESAAALFRVVQEALTNVVRHSGAKEVRVSLKPGTRLLRISIADDGKGITRPQINDRNSFGIVGMRERVHRIGGDFNIFSLSGQGTRLEITIPLK